MASGTHQPYRGCWFLRSFMGSRHWRWELHATIHHYTKSLMLLVFFFRNGRLCTNRNLAYFQINFKSWLLLRIERVLKRTYTESVDFICMHVRMHGMDAMQPS